MPRGQVSKHSSRGKAGRRTHGSMHSRASSSGGSSRKGGVAVAQQQQMATEGVEGVQSLSQGVASSRNASELASFAAAFEP